jgi:hypothetical protein
MHLEGPRNADVLSLPLFRMGILRAEASTNASRSAIAGRTGRASVVA